MNTTGIPAPHLARLASATDLAATPEQRLAAIAELQSQFESMISANVAEIRARGGSWADVASATGLTRQGAQQRWGRD